MQEKFGDIEVFWGYPSPDQRIANGGSKANGVQRVNVIEALLKSTLEPSKMQTLDARLAARECMQAFFADHPGIRIHVLRRAIDGHLSGQDQIPNILTALVTPPESRGNADPYQTWMAAVLMFHLLFESTECKAMAMKVSEGDAEKGEEVITCVQAIAGNLVTGMQRGDDERISIGYLMLLCGWLFEEPDVVNDFLGEGSSVQSLLQVIKQRGAANVLVPGLCTALLGIIYEFSTKDSPISRTTIHKLLIEQLGREQYMDKITKLRASHWVRDFEVLPQTSEGEHDGGLPDVFFDGTFIDFLKDNFRRLIWAIDRDPGLEISVITNGVQKGISRELVDSLRSQLEDRNRSVQSLESDLLALRHRLDQETFDHRRTKEHTAAEFSKAKQIIEGLQRNHEEELSDLKDYHSRARNELLKEHSGRVQAIDSQLKAVSAEYEKNGIKAREYHEAEVADLKRTILKLESEYGGSRQQHAVEVSYLKRTVQDLQAGIDDTRQRRESESAELKNTIQGLKLSLDKTTEKAAQDLRGLHEEYASKLSTLEKRAKEAESRAERAEANAKEASETLKKAQEESRTQVLEIEEKEKSRKAADSSAKESSDALKKTQEELEKVRRVADEKAKSDKTVQAQLEKARAEAKEREEARKTAQSELEDLLIVFGDLESKREQDKVSLPLCCLGSFSSTNCFQKRLKDLGQEVSEDEDEDEEGDEENEVD